MNFLVKIFIFFLLISSELLAVDIIDSLKNQLNNAGNENQIKIFIKIANIKISKLDWTAKEEIEKSYDLNDKVKNDSLEAEVNLIAASYYKIFGLYDKAISKLLLARNYFKKEKNQNKFLDAELTLVEIYRAGNIYDKGINLAEKVVELCKSIKSRKHLARSYNLLAAIYLQKPMDIDRKINIIRKYITSSNQFTEKDDFTYLSNLNILGAIYTYSMKKKFADSARFYLFKALSLSKKMNDQYLYPTILINLANFYFFQNDDDSSLYYSLICEKFLQKSQQSIISPTLYAIISQVYAKKKDFEKAYKYLNLNRESMDTLYNNKRFFMLAEIENQKKMSDKEKQLLVEQQKNTFILGIGTLSLIFLISIIFIYISKQKLLKTTNKKISLQNDELQELNETKDKFFSIIAHDLKNPIHSAKSLSEMLYEDFDNLADNEKKELLKIMTNSSENLAQLLENLLLWANSQKGSLKYTPVNINLYDLTQNITNLLQTQAVNKSITLKNNIPENTFAYADMSMINTVIRNLISNSLKFTPAKGHIEINYKEVDDNFIEISISDNGVGIDKDKIKNLFTISKNTSTNGTNNEKGTGLGLILCKEFVEANKGNINAVSEIGKGTTFSFTLPKKKP